MGIRIVLDDNEKKTLSQSLINAQRSIRASAVNSMDWAEYWLYLIYAHTIQDYCSPKAAIFEDAEWFFDNNPYGLDEKTHNKIYEKAKIERRARFGRKVYK